jgi:hypothetical protein
MKSYYNKPASDWPPEHLAGLDDPGRLDAAVFVGILAALLAVPFCLGVIAGALIF